MKNWWLVLGLVVSFSVDATLSAKTDVQTRYDDRSGKAERYQYRVRFYPQWQLDDDNQWSVNAFAATGDEFASSHNTLDDNKADHIFVRRLYLRHQTTQGKTEIGVIPTYKGRVSSTGLSKDGWIAGIRHVTAYGHGRLEVVVGDLEDIQATNALETPKDLNFFELEYSSQLSGSVNYELSAERLLSSNFLRGELRYDNRDNTTYAFEIINRLTNNESKVVISAEGSVNWTGTPIAFFTYYSYSTNEFGPRAELTEDFLSNGHGVSLELSSRFSPQLPFEWFARFEAFEGNTRVMLGAKYRLTL